MNPTYASDASSAAQGTQASINDFAKNSGLEISRYAYLCGITHKLDADERAKVQSTFELDAMLRQGKLAQEFLDDAEFAELADEIADYVDTNDPNVFFSNAYGIVHGIVDDELKTRLLTKHGFLSEGGKPFRGRNDELDALFAETQRILYPSLFDAADKNPESTSGTNWFDSPANPLNASKIREDRTHRAVRGDIPHWSPNADATVDACLNQCSCLLTEAESIFLLDDDISNASSGAVRLVELAHVLLSELHEKLIVHARENIKPLFQDAKVAA